jgi:hypothetical protein
VDEKRLEELLDTAKKEADQFFSGWEAQLTSLKISHKNGHKLKDKFPQPNWKRLGLVFICLLLCLFIPYQVNKSSNALPQSIVLDEREPAQLVDFVPIVNPAHSKHSQLAVLWHINPQGQYELVYSSLFNDSVFPKPVSTLAFPDSPYSMALLSSEDGTKKYLHYRLIGYSQEDVKTFLAEDYVLGGKLNIEDGKMVEERDDGLVTHIIPCQVDEDGELLLTADQVELQLGEELLLIGLNFLGTVKFLPGKDILEEVSKKNGSIQETRFTASNIGEDYLHLTPNLDPTKSKTIYIKVNQ